MCHENENCGNIVFIEHRILFGQNEATVEMEQMNKTDYRCLKKNRTRQWCLHANCIITITMERCSSNIRTHAVYVDCERRGPENEP